MNIEVTLFVIVVIAIGAAMLYQHGVTKGHNEGYHKGKHAGYRKGKHEGSRKGYGVGFSRGRRSRKNQRNDTTSNSSGCLLLVVALGIGFVAVTFALASAF